MAETKIRIYEFLLADPMNDEEYSEGNRVGNSRVYCTALEMVERLNDSFRKKPIRSAINLGDGTPVWHYSNNTVKFEAKRDSKRPTSPFSLGYLTVVGTDHSICRLNDLLTRIFPRIDGSISEKEY